MINKILKNGIAINKYIKNKNEIFIKANYKFITFEGMRFIVANIQSNSMVVDSMDHNEFDAALLFGFNGKKWKVSMYTNDADSKVDVSVIARKYNGGGHAGAAGFYTDFDTIKRIIEEKL